MSKLTMAALEATLRIYATGHRLEERLPTLERLARPQPDIRLLGERIATVLTGTLAPAFTVTLEECASQVGSGSMPIDRLPSVAIVIRPQGKVSGRVIERLQDRMRALPMPIIGRIAEGALWLDMRCLMPRDEAAFVANLAAL